MSFIIGGIIVAYAVYIIAKNIKDQTDGSCSGCSSCPKECSYKKEDKKN